MENKIKHLEFIQLTITRMASNSFLLKGWTVTLIVGILAFANTDDMNPKYLWIAIIPAVFFWFLDGFYLHQEKLFRELYDDVRNKEEDDIDFTMNTMPYSSEVASWGQVCLSKTLLIFYLPVIAVIGIAMIIFAKI
ncbi:hypothetical protein [Priestia megaterium]|uniref:hypothetical protein n=1 Tax=Priestia megaterium TaxID=1404 RepID=UPI002FFE44E8